MSSQPQIELLSRYLPLDEPIDLLNVAFENPRTLSSNNRASKRKEPGAQSRTYLVPDRETGLEEVEELRRLCPGRKWNFVCMNYLEATCFSHSPARDQCQF